MHWIRVDTYYQGDRDNPKAYFQPVPCMQCENAPCEVVCPVGATVHSTEGLNDMVYNRCVGTRYCSNNCPYKVRRFNFLLFQDWETPQLKMMRNPGRHRAQPRRDGKVHLLRPAHQRSIASTPRARTARSPMARCRPRASRPARPNAIVFGNINDPNSRVSKLKAHPRNYALLADLNTRPRTTYLAEVRNPNPELQEKSERSRKRWTSKLELELTDGARRSLSLGIFATVTDKISSIVLTRPTLERLVGRASALSS